MSMAANTRQLARLQWMKLLPTKPDRRQDKGLGLQTAGLCTQMHMHSAIQGCCGAAGLPACDMAAGQPCPDHMLSCAVQYCGAACKSGTSCPYLFQSRFGDKGLGYLLLVDTKNFCEVLRQLFSLFAREPHFLEPPHLDSHSSLNGAGSSFSSLR